MALNEYVKHKDYCDKDYILGDGKCTCGLDEELEVYALCHEPEALQQPASVEEAAKAMYPDFKFDGVMGPTSRKASQELVELKRECFKAGAEWKQQQLIKSK